MNSEKRKSNRLNFTREYFYCISDKNKKINCKLNNISVTGACITSDKKIEKEDIVFLHIKGMEDIVLKSKAVWKIENQYGLQFILDSGKEFENISYIINNINNFKQDEKDEQQDN